MKWVVNGNIPTRINSKEEKSTSVDSLDVINKLRTTIFSDPDIKSIIKVLKDRGYISSAIISKSPETKSVNDFLLEFWDFERSPYIKEKKLKGQSSHRSYCETMRSRVMIYWLPKIGNRMVGSITRDNVKKIFDDENVLKLDPKTINSIVSSLIIPMKWALYNDLTEINCFDGIIKCSVKSKTRTILTLEQAAAVFSISWENDSAKLANELAFYTGMRQEENSSLTGFSDATTTVFPDTHIQHRIIHMIRNSATFVSYKDLKAVCKALKELSLAVNAPAEHETLIECGKIECPLGT